MVNQQPQFFLLTMDDDVVMNLPLQVRCRLGRWWSLSLRHWGLDRCILAPEPCWWRDDLGGTNAGPRRKLQKKVLEFQLEYPSIQDRKDDSFACWLNNHWSYPLVVEIYDSCLHQRWQPKIGSSRPKLSIWDFTSSTSHHLQLFQATATLIRLQYQVGDAQF